MPNATRLDQVSTVSYQANVELALNETPGKLYPTAGSSAMYKSKKSQILDRFDDLYLSDKTTRNGDTNNVEVGSERRWITKPPSANVAPLIDRDDWMQTSVDIESPVVQQTARATRRYHDDMFVEGLLGNVYAGEEGGDLVGFKQANKVAAGGVGLTLPKLIALRELINLNDVDIESEKPIMLLTPGAESSLLQIEEYKNIDYNGDKPLMNGEIKPWMGFRFISVNLGSKKAFPRSADLTKSNGVRSLPVYLPSGIHRGVWEEFFGRVTERDDKQFSKQVYGEACSRVVRLHEDKAYLMDIVEA